MFHGSTGTHTQFLRISGWREQADATGLVAVFPQGLRYRVLDSGRLSSKWNSFDLASEVDLSERPRGYPESSPWPADDVGFVDSIIADLRSELPIDRHRVFASGFSNGGAFTARLAVERSTELAAAAFSGGGLDAVHSPARPIPMYNTVGTLDDRVLAQTGPPAFDRAAPEPVRGPGRAGDRIDRRRSREHTRAGPSRLRRALPARLHVFSLAGSGVGVPAARCSASPCSAAWRTTTPTVATIRRASRRPRSSGSSSRSTRCPESSSCRPSAGTLPVRTLPHGSLR